MIQCRRKHCTEMEKALTIMTMNRKERKHVSKEYHMKKKEMHGLVISEQR